MMRLSLEEFMDLVEQAVASLPPEFEPYMENVSVEVQPLPDRKLLGSMHIRGSGRNLLGLYHGVPLGRKSVMAPYEFPERIFIFQRNIEAICNSPDDIVREVRHTVLHEVGHHFGMTEEDLDKLGYG